jgi:ubiquitin-conjugating enzyme E2 Z
MNISKKIKNNKQISISSETTRRLIKDVRENIHNPLTSNGIYYIHSDTDILTGYALIIGPENTPYHRGFYFFRFNFPPDYPYSPPSISFHTNGNNVRFHPNFYRNGKVCMSILNTWKGEQWSSCLSLNNILNAILSLFIVSQPLTLEPLWCINDTIQLENYNKIIKHANISISVCDFLNNTHHPFYHLFHSTCISYFLEHYETINQSIQIVKNEDIYIPLYKLQYKIDNIYLTTQLRTTYFNLHTIDN